jgi:flavin reductase (DIM6/NTAB) family NADH-FMN oxidoreductase RutF
MIQIKKQDILKMDKIYRLNLINSIPGYKSANLIGTKSSVGQTNLTVFSSVIHVGSNPALLGFIVRPAVVPRHTYTNLKSTGVFTINHVHKNIVDKAHYTSAKFNENVSEFNAVGLTEEYLSEFYAPFVKESKIKVACSFVEEHEIKANNTILVIGEIQSIFLPDFIVSENGEIDLDYIDDVCISGLYNYHEAKRMAAFDYSRPGKIPKNKLQDK